MKIHWLQWDSRYGHPILWMPAKTRIPVWLYLQLSMWNWCYDGWTWGIEWGHLLITWGNAEL